MDLFELLTKKDVGDIGQTGPGLTFLIYAGVIVRPHPWRAQALFQYLDLIYRAYVDFAGQAWLLYD